MPADSDRARFVSSRSGAQLRPLVLNTLEAGQKFGRSFDGSDFHADVALRLSFPDYYGRNLNAFNDCIRDVEVSAAGGRAIVLRRFDSFARREPQVAQHILDILALASWHHLLFGNRLITLVQSDDPSIAFEPVGSHPVVWNPREWMTGSRGL